MEIQLANGVHHDDDVRPLIESYKDFDLSRQNQLEQLADQYMALKLRFSTVEADLEDERATRRNYRRQAEDAKAAIVS